MAEKTEKATIVKGKDRGTAECGLCGAQGSRAEVEAHFANFHPDRAKEAGVDVAKALATPAAPVVDTEAVERLQRDLERVTAERDEALALLADATSGDDGAEPSDPQKP